MFVQDDPLGPYVLITKLGQGQFGLVWLAEKRTALATTPFAIKLPLGSNVDLEAIRKEAKAWIAASGHPNVLPIIEADVYNGQVVIVSEYAPGGSLREWLNRNGGQPSSIEAALEMANGILAGLEHLHARSIIHRDLKPENILLQGETPRIADFGIAKVLTSSTQSQLLKGTPLYMAPEAFDGERSPQTDIWSTGVILYEMFAGHRPFPAKAGIWEQVVMVKTRDPDPLLPSVPESLRTIILGALKRDCAERYKSAAEMRKAWREASWQIFAGGAGATIIEPPALIVSPFGAAHHRTISEALTKAEPGTRILVRPGIYNEGLVIDKRVEIVGDGPVDEIVVEASDADCILMQSDQAIVRGLTLHGRAGTTGGEFYCVDIPQGRLVLEDCDITSDSLSCVGIHGSTSTPIIRRCKIHDGQAGGVFVYTKGKGVIESCDIYGNKLAGIEIREEGNLTVRGCKIHDGQQGGISVHTKGKGMIEGCDIYGNKNDGVAIREKGNPTVRDCKINRNEYHGVRVYRGGAGRIENCDLTGNKKGPKYIEARCSPVFIGNEEQ
jgi:parallel beta-helix repeat protein